MFVKSPRLNLKKHFFSLFIFINLLIFNFSIAESQQWINNCIDLTVNSKFDKAEMLLQHKIENTKTTADSIEIYFYLASVYNSEMTHFENKEKEQPFRNAVSKVAQLS